MTDPTSKKEILERLKLSMQKEVNMMREILSNMHREELSLQFNDKTSWEHVMIERAEMIDRLSMLRKTRMLHTEQFEKEAPYADNESVEILSLRDQIVALAERMNLIKCRNEYLSQHIVIQQGAPSRTIQPAREAQRLKRKTSIATYPPKE
ncbi:MAG: hypothetical protein V4494_04995 [Chlamydiota bacterium]